MSTSPAQRRKFDKSLGALARRFMYLLASSPGCIFDLRQIAKILGVPRRRIDDVTHILESIHVIKKLSKNRVQLECFRVSVEDEDKLTALHEDLAELQSHEDKLDELLKTTENQLRRFSEDPLNKELTYMTSQDLQRIQSLQEQQILCFKTQCGHISITPDLKMHIRSDKTPIDVLSFSNCSTDTTEAQFHDVAPMQWTTDHIGMQGQALGLPSVPMETEQSVSQTPLTDGNNDKDLIYSGDLLDTADPSLNPDPQESQNTAYRLVSIEGDQMDAHTVDEMAVSPRAASETEQPLPNAQLIGGDDDNDLFQPNSGDRLANADPSLNQHPRESQNTAYYRLVSMEGDHTAAQTVDEMAVSPRAASETEQPLANTQLIGGDNDTDIFHPNSGDRLANVDPSLNQGPEESQSMAHDRLVNIDDDHTEDEMAVSLTAQTRGPMFPSASLDLEEPADITDTDLAHPKLPLDFLKNDDYFFCLEEKVGISDFFIMLEDSEPEL